MCYVDMHKRSVTLPEEAERRPVAHNHHRLHGPNPAPLRAASAGALRLPRATKSRRHMKLGIPRSCAHGLGMSSRHRNRVIVVARGNEYVRGTNITRHPREAAGRRPVAPNHHRLHEPTPAPLRAAFAGALRLRATGVLVIAWGNLAPSSGVR